MSPLCAPPLTAGPSPQGGERSLAAILEQIFSFDAAGLGDVNYLPPANATQRPIEPSVPIVLDSAPTLTAPLAAADWRLARSNGLGSTEDILIGGEGSDITIGEPGHDLLVGGFA